MVISREIKKKFLVQKKATFGHLVSVVVHPFHQKSSYSMNTRFIVTEKQWFGGVDITQTDKNLLAQNYMQNFYTGT